MADIFNIYKKCINCDGTGSVGINDEPLDPGPPDSITCPFCDGDGEIYWGRTEEVV